MKAGALRELALLCREIGRGQGRFGVCLESSVREQEEFGTILGSIPALTDVDALPGRRAGKPTLRTPSCCADTTMPSFTVKNRDNAPHRRFRLHGA